LAFRPSSELLMLLPKLQFDLRQLPLQLAARLLFPSHQGHYRSP
jgi:hypothetical protein